MQLLRIIVLPSKKMICFSTDTSNRGAFDISFFAAVASHLAYWTDADVAHFMISQLLSRQRVIRRRKSMGSVRV